MKKIMVTGKQAYDIGVHTNCYHRNKNNGKFELIKFDRCFEDYIFIRDIHDCSIFLREKNIYQLYTK